MIDPADHPHDDAIKALKLEGWRNCEIEEILELPKWLVSGTILRLGLETPKINLDPHEVYFKKPLVEKTCPACQKKHMSHPAIWTCKPCKAKQENGGSSDQMTCEPVIRGGIRDDE